MHVNFNLSVIIILYISKMSSSFLNVLQKIICLMIMIKFLFLSGECQSRHHLLLLGLILLSLSVLLPLLALHWLWHRATLRSNWAIKPLTSMLCQESGLAQRFSLFGRSSSEPEELSSCYSDTAISSDSSEDTYATDIHARYNLSLSD